jgi:uncharacterized protein
LDIQIPQSVLPKWKKLMAAVQTTSSAVVCYSGGVDSSFLSWAVHSVLGDKMIAVTISSIADPPEMLARSQNFATTVGFRQLILPLDLLNNPGFRTNPPDRCYHCKKQILTTIWDYARSNGYRSVYDGQNADDLHDYRPGWTAVEETGTISPLLAAGFTKPEIRSIAKENGLNVWDMPSTPCLATRIPYHEEITAEALRRISQAESFLHSKGFDIVRVRSSQQEARIEVEIRRFSELLAFRGELVDTLKRLGFTRVTLDMQGFRSGSMNEGILP